MHQSFAPLTKLRAVARFRRSALPFISTLVDIGNTMSLEKLMPIGLHPIENIVGQLPLFAMQ